eukprot:1157748-Pelagomonas_calceolata.AAC.1
MDWQPRPKSSLYYLTIVEHHKLWHSTAMDWQPTRLVDRKVFFVFLYHRCCIPLGRPEFVLK